MMTVGQYWHLGREDERWAAIANLLTFNAFFILFALLVTVFVTYAPLLGIDLERKDEVNNVEEK